MKYNIIAIEREYASGGRDIGFLTAKKLGIPCYGIEILEMVAEKHNVSIDLLYALEENTTNSLLYSIGLLSNATSSDFAKSLVGLSNTDALYHAEMKIIKELASKGPCILIGHCAGNILSERQDVLRIFVHSDLESRQKRAVEIYGLSKKDADSVLRQTDKRRANYYNAHSKTKWDARESYHIMINNGKLGAEASSDILFNIFKRQNISSQI